ncbi:hypothetical protein N2152v2_008863 [Parachlorella kessleri]
MLVTRSRRQAASSAPKLGPAEQPVFSNHQEAAITADLLAPACLSGAVQQSDATLPPTHLFPISASEAEVAVAASHPLDAEQGAAGSVAPSNASTGLESPAAAGIKKRKARARKGGVAGAAPSLDPSRLEELQSKGLQIAEQLRGLYPDPPIPLDHASHFQLLCAVLLSAQTTDKKVNEVTPALFKLAPDAAAMAALAAETIEGCIRQLGLAPTKAKNLQAMAQMLVERHGGEVPDSFEALEALPGVGHKTASVVMAQCFGHAAFPVDTHIHRLAQRWGLTAGRSVEQTEADLKLVFPEPLWHDLHLQIIYFGREVCPARGHDPTSCPICSWAAVPPFDKLGSSPLKPGQRFSGEAKPNNRGTARAVPPGAQ